MTTNSPGAAGFLEAPIDASVMESYFHEHMVERDLLFHDLVARHLTADSPDLLAIIKQEGAVK